MRAIINAVVASDACRQGHPRFCECSLWEAFKTPSLINTHGGAGAVDRYTDPNKPRKKNEFFAQ